MKDIIIIGMVITAPFIPMIIYGIVLVIINRENNDKPKR